MANKVRGTERWSEVVQVMITADAKAALVEEATVRGVSQSTVARELLMAGIDQLRHGCVGQGNGTDLM